MKRRTKKKKRNRVGLSRHSSDPRLRKLADELHKLEFGK